MLGSKISALLGSKVTARFVGYVSSLCCSESYSYSGQVVQCSLVFGKMKIRVCTGSAGVMVKAAHFAICSDYIPTCQTETLLSYFATPFSNSHSQPKILGSQYGHLGSN